MFIKVCGITDIVCIDWAIELGYDAVGVVLYKNSKRYCPPPYAAGLAKYARNRIKTVAVSVAFKDVADVREEFDYVQVYEPARTEHLIYAAKKRPLEDLQISGRDFEFFLYDASQGQGRLSDFPGWLRDYRDKLIIAGGLKPGNVKKIIEKVKPFGVDVSTGVEKKDRKDYELMRAFIAEVRNAKM